MKTMKTLVALVLAMTLTLSLAGAAFAAVNDNVSVSIGGIRVGDTLKLYQIAKTEYNATTNQLDWTWNGGLDADDFDFTDEGTTFSQNSDGQKAALAAYIALKNVSGQPKYTQAVTGTTGELGTATVSVEPGYYVAIVEGSANSGFVYQRMLINAIQTVDADNNTYAAHGTISATMKKEPITITKTEDLSATDATQVTTTDNYHIGDTIKFTLTTSIPSYPEDSTNATFVITDTPNGLDDDETSVQVFVNGSTTATAAGTDTFTVAGTTKGFTVTFAKNFILAHPAESVVVKYSAVLEGPVNLDGETSNTATITYNPNPTESTTVTPPGPTDEQNIYGVVVYKYDETDSSKGTALPGASFKLVEANAAGDAPANPEVVLKTGITDENGYISWSGLKNGTYYLIETAAPAGYRLDATPIQVVLNNSTATADDPTTGTTENPVVETYFNIKEVPNSPGTTLPSTGGIGTTIFYIAGIVMVCGAAAILVARRKAEQK